LNPHFLFNSLNALKSLIKRDPNLAENYLIGLSNFLRFSISHSEQNVVSLEQELKFSMYYLEVQKVRFREAISYSVDIPLPQQVNTMLPVFSLQLALENAIKHNKLTQEEPLNIRIVYIEPDLLLVENNVNLKVQVEPASGMGLKNLSDRYFLLTKGGITVNHSNDCFQVYLKLISK
jgi:LytS/YehU family sensor histidine kinase